MKNLPSDDFRVSIPNFFFQKYLSKEGIIVSDGTVAYGDIKGISEVSCHQILIGDLEGIQYFTALTSLSCGSNQLTSLDVSKNSALTSLSCGGNQLTSLDVSKNSALTYLDCGDNKLTSLDVSKDNALTTLWCDGNKFDIKSFDNDPSNGDYDDFDWKEASFNALTDGQYGDYDDFNGDWDRLDDERGA